MNAILSLAMGYFVGCINPAAWVGKKKHVDLKQSGTGNLGATNTALVLGKNAGYFVLFFDIFKSFFSYKAARLLFPGWRQRLGCWQASACCWATASRCLCTSRAARDWLPSAALCLLTTLCCL